MIDSIRQFKFLPIATSRTVLRSENRVDLNRSFPGPFCLEFEKIKKLPPCNIGYGFINAAEVIFLHIIDRKVFNDYGIEFINKFSGFLMGKVFTLPGNAFIYTSDYLASFSVKLRSLGLFRELPLHFIDLCLFLFKESWVINLGPIGEGGKRFKPHVNTNGWFDQLLYGNIVNNAGKSNIPFSGCRSSDRAGFYHPLNRPMEIDLDAADFGKLNYIFKQLEAGLRVGKRIIPKLSPKSRIAWRFSMFNSTEKGSECKVKPDSNFLKDLTKDIAKKFIFFFKSWNRIGMVIPGNRFFFGFPGIFPFLKETVVKPATPVKCFIQLGRLTFIWEYPIFKGLTHSAYILTFKILNVKNYLKEGAGFHLPVKTDSFPARRS